MSERVFVQSRASATTGLAEASFSEPQPKPVIAPPKPATKPDVDPGVNPSRRVAPFLPPDWAEPGQEPNPKG